MLMVQQSDASLELWRISGILKSKGINWCSPNFCRTSQECFYHKPVFLFTQQKHVFFPWGLVILLGYQKMRIKWGQRYWHPRNLKKRTHLFMKEILHRLGCIKPCRYWDKLPFPQPDFLHQQYMIGITWSFPLRPRLFCYTKEFHYNLIENSEPVRSTLMIPLMGL